MLVTAYTEDALKSKLSFFFERSHKVNQSLSSACLSYDGKQWFQANILKKSEIRQSFSLSLSYGGEQ